MIYDSSHVKCTYGVKKKNIVGMRMKVVYLFPCSWIFQFRERGFSVKMTNPSDLECGK